MCLLLRSCTTATSRTTLQTSVPFCSCFINSLLPQNALSGEVAVQYQNFLICIEMFLASLAHQFAFSNAGYKAIGVGNSSADVAANFKEV